MQPVNKLTNKPSPEPPIRQNAQQAVAQQAAAQQAKTVPAAKISPAPPRSTASLIAAAGLPADKLSASIISFARFFSLPIKPDLMADIRRQAFAPAAQQAAAQQAAAQAAGPAEQASPAQREALSLAAAAAEGKGVELREKALEAYAERIDPEWQEQHSGEGDEGGGHRRKRQNNQNEKEEGEARKTAPVSAAGIKEAALEAEANNPLLEILNRLPGKDGRRWVVLPLQFEDNGRLFKVSLRILLEPENTGAGYMALDILEAQGEEKQRRLFVLEAPPHSLLPTPHSLSLYLQSEISAKDRTSLCSELSSLLGINPDRVTVKTTAEPFPFEADCGDDLLRSIDEAV
jgi:hypothetical protein